MWKDAIVQWPSFSRQYPPRSIEEMVLVYSYFSGSFEKDPGRTHEGRPVYVEMKKSSDRTPFDDLTPQYNPYDPGSIVHIDSIMPATIKYCGGHWIFTHDYIRKTMKDTVSRSSSVVCHYSCLYLILFFLDLSNLSPWRVIAIGWPDRLKQRGLIYWMSTVNGRFGRE